MAWVPDVAGPGWANWCGQTISQECSPTIAQNLYLSLRNDVDHGRKQGLKATPPKLWWSRTPSAGTIPSEVGGANWFSVSVAVSPIGDRSRSEVNGGGEGEIGDSSGTSVELHGHRSLKNESSGQPQKNLDGRKRTAGPALIVLISQDYTAFPFPPLARTCWRDHLRSASGEQYIQPIRNTGDSPYGEPGGGDPDLDQE